MKLMMLARRGDNHKLPPALFQLLLWVTTATMIFSSCCSALDNGLARTPPMGWLAWERFTCQTDCARYPNDCISERLFLEMAKRLQHDGWRDAGYQYMNIDDCWSEMERSPIDNRLVASRERFPSGIKQLARQVHDLGLKLGIYGDCGTKTCAGYPAQLSSDPLKMERENHFRLDSETLADWQVDSFKFDGCYIDPLKAESICPQMARALNETKRPILLVCEWPFYMMYAHGEPDFELAAQSCNAWRYFDDIEDSWSSVLNTIDYTIKHQSTIVKFHGPGHWFDPDQLVIGNFGLSFEQARAQMALWSVWAAPLYMSNDLRSISPEAESILKNRHLIGVNQDPLGVFGLMAQQTDDKQFQAFVKPIEPIRNGCPSFAIVYLNRKTLGNKEKISFKIRDLLLGAPIKQAARNQLSISAGQLYSDSRADKDSDAAATDGHDKATNQSGDAADERQSSPNNQVEKQQQQQQQQPRQMDMIQVSKCLKRIREGVAVANQKDEKDNDGSTEGQQQPKQDWLQPAIAEEANKLNKPKETMGFDVFDLFENGKKINGDELLAPNDKLELLVAPSSVRAIRLVERQAAPAAEIAQH